LESRLEEKYPPPHPPLPPSWRVKLTLSVCFTEPVRKIYHIRADQQQENRLLSIRIRTLHA